MNIRPPRLQPGDGIGIIAPASPVEPSELSPAIDLLTSKGYQVSCAPHLYDSVDYLAGHDNVRIDDLHSMFSNRNIKAILCARGGYGTPRILDRIDFTLIRQNPKIIVGYSDITALLMAINKMTGLVCFHGPLAGKNECALNLNDLIALVSTGGPLDLSLSGGAVLNKGKAHGILLGGNLSLLSALIGTPFIPSFKGAILFVEDRGEPLYRIDRMLTHLRLCGLLDGLSGLVAGRFEGCGDPSAIGRLMQDIMSGLDIPILTGLPVGHGRENVTLPVGLTADLDTEKMSLAVSDLCVSE
ncbi:MAG: LD-carboxypeptidase [Deltaproteobacteria bacterium]|nr:LD-carboxypeptidase [Deltaproteobacteria bacterium]